MQSDLDQRERWLTNKQFVVRGYPELIDPKKKFIEHKQAGLTDTLVGY